VLVVAIDPVVQRIWRTQWSSSLRRR
jgi:hypothetical protein